MKFLKCMFKPCCELCKNSPELKERIGVVVTPYDVIFQSKKIGQVSYAPIVGDSIFDYIVWAVDYGKCIVYVTK